MSPVAFGNSCTKVKVLLYYVATAYPRHYVGAIAEMKCVVNIYSVSYAAYASESATYDQVYDSLCNGLTGHG